MKNRQRRFPLSYQRFATIVKMFCHGFRKEIREQINMDLFESENILEIIEEAIVNECYNDQYIN